MSYMRIVTWNCNGALRRKLAAADSLQADILIVQECEDPARSDSSYLEWAGTYLWVGETKNRGVGVFSRTGHSLTALEWSGLFVLPGLQSESSSIAWSTDDLRVFLPFSVDNELTILAVWTKGGNDQVFGYVGQLWKYLQIHSEDLSGKKTIIAGDLNSNSRWDKSDRWWNHSDVVLELKAVGLSSAYHFYFQEEQGQETRSTFYLNRNPEKGYHIDYFFVSFDLLERAFVELGDYRKWGGFSDHVPLVLDVV